MGQRSNSKKHGMEKTWNGKNVEWDKTSNGTKRRMENIRRRLKTYLDIDIILLLVISNKYHGQGQGHGRGHGHGQIMLLKFSTDNGGQKMSTSMCPCPWT
jgi:hypothetical protein